MTPTRECEWCGRGFPVRAKSPNQRFCGLSCSASRPGPRKPEPVRFWAKVEKTEECWLWRGSISPGGYGQFAKAGRRLVPAHRWAWEQENGPIPPGMQMDHLCRNRACVRPAHLEPVTRAVNVQRGLKGDLRPPNPLRDTCVNGHAMTGENSVRRTERLREQYYCRTCRRADRRRWARKQRAAAKAVA